MLEASTVTEMNKKLLIPGLIGVAIVGAVIYFTRRPSLEAQAATLMDCLMDQDAACVLRYIDSGDRAAYQLDKPKITLLLSRFHQTLRPEQGGVEVAKQPGATMVVCQAPFVSNINSKQLTVGFLLSETGEGVKAPQFVTQALLALSAASAPAKGTGGISKLEAWEYYAREKGPEWQRDGFPGILRDPEEGMLQWSEWAKHCRDRIQKAKARTPGVANS